MALLTSCADKDKNGNVLDTPTAGTITITVDEALKPLIDAEIKAFEGIYHNAHINVRYTSEGEALDGLLKDSARLAIITRRLVESEQKILARPNYRSPAAHFSKGWNCIDFEPTALGQYDDP